MAEISSSVRLLQHHLRQAGTLLAARQLDAASEHIDAALAIDSASLAAQALRERLTAFQTASAGNTAASRGDRPPVASPRFVPSGVSTASWLDFEQRVQDRRYRALLGVAERAIDSGDMPSARQALDEARELQPDASDVARLASRMAAMTVSGAAAARREGLMRSRTWRAASLLLLGVGLLMGLDWVRSDATEAVVANRPVVAAALVPNTAVADVVPEPERRIERMPDAAGTSGTGAELPVLEARHDAPMLAPAPVIARTRPTDELEVARGEIPDDYVAIPSSRALRPSVFPPPVLRGEVPDDYVAPPRGSSATVARTAANAGPVANVARVPASVVDAIVTPSPLPSSGNAGGNTAGSLSAPAALPTPAAALVVTSTLDEQRRVAEVLQQYASAYGSLDAGAVRAVWPSVDQRALAKAFSSLSSQTVSFERCSIDVSTTGTTAQASCHGKATYVGRVGSQERRTESRTVNFELKREGEAWRIQKAETRR